MLGALGLDLENVLSIVLCQCSSLPMKHSLVSDLHVLLLDLIADEYLFVACCEHSLRQFVIRCGSYHTLVAIV